MINYLVSLHGYRPPLAPTHTCADHFFSDGVLRPDLRFLFLF
jgi:hypothetical protein